MNENAGKLTSIPELIKRYGTMAETCRATGLNEYTLARYRFDVKCERHVIYNNRLMTHKSHSAVLFTKRGIARHDRGY